MFGNGAKPATSSLFGAPPASGGGLFGSQPPASGSLFGSGAATTGGSLFGNANAGPTLFKFGSGDNKATDANKSGDDDDDAEEEGEKSPPIYADSTTKVEFKGAGAQTIQPSPYTKVFDVSMREKWADFRSFNTFLFPGL